MIDNSEVDEKWGSCNKVSDYEINNQAIIYYSNRLIYKNDDINLYIINDFERYNFLKILNDDYYCFLNFYS